MAEKVRLASLEEIPVGAGAEIVAAGRVFAVYNVDGQIHILDGVCPHAGGPLGKGTLEGCVVTCPWHGWQLDVTNGHHCLNANIQQPSFESVVEDGDVFVLV
ncbi:MAG: ferredoxin [Planctomycetaceae bacterium]|nr:ferredoxin [Planctomycetaceae bacterium]